MTKTEKEMERMKTQIEQIAEMRSEITAQGGAVLTLEEVPLEIEAQLLRRALRRPEYIGIERQSRPEGI